MYPDDIPFVILRLAVRNALLGAVVLAAVSFLLRGRLERGFRSIERLFSRFAARKGLAIAALFLGVLVLRVALLSRFPVPTPGIADEHSYLLLGDTLAHGRLANTTHPLWISFETFHEIWQPVYASMYPPAQGFVLAAGQILGHPWIGVLLSGACMSAAILWMLQAWLPPRWALLGALLAAMKLTVASYWMNSYWGGFVAATGGALLLGGLGRVLKRARAGDALLMGLGIALLANSRPFEGFFFALPSAVYFLAWLFGKVRTQDDAKRRFRTVFLPLAAVLAATGAFILYYDWRLTGNPLLLPHLMADRAHTTPYFVWEKRKPPKKYRNAQFDHFYNKWDTELQLKESFAGHTVDKATRYSFAFLWSGALLILPALVFLPRRRKTRFLLVTFLVTETVTILFLFSFSHYVAAETCVIFALLVQGIRHLRTVRGRARPWGVLLSRASIVLLVLLVARDVRNRLCDPMVWPCQGEPRRAALLERLEHTPGRHLVLVHYGAKHDSHREWVFNGADIDGSKVLFARELDPAQNARLLEYFRDRQVWEVDPDASPGKPTPPLSPVRAPVSAGGA